MISDPSEAKMIQHSKSYLLLNTTIENPYEYEQAQNYLKQMEIECMNIIDASGVEGDLVRQRIQKHKAEFDRIRKEIRKKQQEYERS